MNHFWLFPLFLGIAGILIALIVLEESTLTGWTGDKTQPSWLRSPQITKWAAFGGVAGTLWGMGIALFDWVRNRHHDRTGIYASAGLIPNLWWCLLYGGAVYLLNLAVLFGCLLVGINILPVMNFPWQWLVHLTFVLVLNAGALVWASIRCVLCDDVLSPLLLRQKLRRSTQLTG